MRVSRCYAALVNNITIGRYSSDDHGYAGWIEPSDRSWIVFVGVDGHAEFYGDRDQDGAVL
jgi:hypothetical protein